MIFQKTILMGFIFSLRRFLFAPASSVLSQNLISGNIKLSPIESQNNGYCLVIVKDEPKTTEGAFAV
jgi:hypothetical protein